jgi:hypothetical protein
MTRRIRLLRASMNWMASSRYARYASKLAGTGDVVKFPNGMKNFTAPLSSTRSSLSPGQHRAADRVTDPHEGGELNGLLLDDL